MSVLSQFLREKGEQLGVPVIGEHAALQVYISIKLERVHLRVNGRRNYGTVFILDAYERSKPAVGELGTIRLDTVHKIPKRVYSLEIDIFFFCQFTKLQIPSSVSRVAFNYTTKRRGKQIRCVLKVRREHGPAAFAWVDIL